MEIEVLVNPSTPSTGSGQAGSGQAGKIVGKLAVTKNAETEVMTEWGPAPKKVMEDAVTELAGEIELPAGRQDILLIPRDIVDGKLTKVAVGE